MERAHLVDSENPLMEGQPVTAFCGAEIPHARFVMQWDQDFLDFGSVNTLLFCRKCAHENFANRYLYGIVNAEEALHQEIG